MPDAVESLLGTIAVKSQTGSQYARTIILGSMPFAPLFIRNCGRFAADGNPSAPSLQQGWGSLGPFDWPVQAGTRTLTIDVKYTPVALPYPNVTIKANSAIGVTADVSGVAPSGSGWVTIGPLTVAPTGNGALALWLNVPHESMEGYALWDNIQTT